MELLRKRAVKHSVLTTDDEIDAAIAKASAIEDEPRVIEAAYVSTGGLDSLVLKMSDNRRKLIPREEIQGLSDAPTESLNNIEISPNGTSLRWPLLDVDLYVPPLLEGIFGSREWMKRLGRRGGLATTPAKAKSSRLNGLKGGRPRKRIGEGQNRPARPNRIIRKTLDDLNYVLFESEPDNVITPETFKQHQAFFIDKANREIEGKGVIKIPEIFKQHQALHGQSQLRNREEGSYEAFSNSYR
jgi:hypothetical protein